MRKSKTEYEIYMTEWDIHFLFKLKQKDHNFIIIKQIYLERHRIPIVRFF